MFTNLVFRLGRGLRARKGWTLKGRGRRRRKRAQRVGDVREQSCNNINDVVGIYLTTGNGDDRK